MLKKIIQIYLEHLTKKYLKKHQPKLVVVTGSVGKTSTKMAIATVLAESYRVRVNDGNHNTHMSVPLAILGVSYPEDVRSIGQWMTVFSAMRLRVSQASDVDVIVQELGTDRPGDIKQFGRYLNPDVAVVTAVSPEHMEFFDTIDTVAREELAVASFAKLTIVNRDDIDSKFAQYATTKSISTYGLGEGAEYRILLDAANPLDGKMGQFISPNWDEISVNIQLVGSHNIKSVVAAGAVAAHLGMASQQIAVGMSKVTPVNGRMNPLRGLKNSTIIDDTYNSSPLAVRAALDTLYGIDAPQRVAVLGSMNELGSQSVPAHTEAGKYCDPNKLAWVITIGDEAEKYLAPAALANGCQVKSFSDPYQAGGFVNRVLEPGSVVLFKGSQNGVFAEEAIKIVLHTNDDESKLVRQDEDWMNKKLQLFERDFPASSTGV